MVTNCQCTIVSKNFLWQDNAYHGNVNAWKMWFSEFNYWWPVLRWLFLHCFGRWEKNLPFFYFAQVLIYPIFWTNCRLVLCCYIKFSGISLFRCNVTFGRPMDLRYWWLDLPALVIRRANALIHGCILSGRLILSLPLKYS